MDEYNVSTRQLWALFTYWCHVCWLKFWWDNLVVDGGQMVLTCESNWHKRKVKEAIYIKQRAPTMNRDQGYHLPAFYNQIIPPKSEPTHVTPVREQGL